MKCYYSLQLNSRDVKVWNELSVKLKLNCSCSKVDGLKFIKIVLREYLYLLIDKLI